jgi:hypothetical protein
MLRTKAVVIKTTGSLFEELQQFVCGHIFQLNFENIKFHYMTSSVFEEEFAEYFTLSYNKISMDDMLRSKYLYNPSEQDKFLQLVEAGEDYDYFIYESKSEFRSVNVDTMTYLRQKSSVHRLLKRNIQEYVLPQLSMLYDSEKINIGLNYSVNDASTVYNMCNVESFNYIDFSCVETEGLKKNGVKKYTVTDDFLLYIALSYCDAIIGDISNVINYESCMSKFSMIHDVSDNSLNTDYLVPIQIVFQQPCLFPNSQILMQYV